MINGEANNNFVMEESMVKTLKNLAAILSENCQCQVIDIFTYILSKYKNKYSKKLAGKTKEQASKIIENDYEYIKNLITQYGKSDNTVKREQTTENKVPIQIERFSILNFSINDELNKLMPDSLGTMKKFFILVLSRYFNNLHPIIWAQIYRGMINNIFIDLPLTMDELFSFVSKYLLLNSGPFILKILQMIRPILSDDLASKYNLTKLTYPLMEPHQIDIVLRNILIDYDMCKIIYNKSASVGHVCIGYNVKNPDDKFVVKIIKPLAISQSCWEYSILKDLFPSGSCEEAFIKNTLRSNGAEMNVANEINNLNRGHDSYTTDYRTEFGLDVDAKLTTIENKPGIVKEETWFALSMTLAPGMPLADLIESKMLDNDTKFRANLHRCLDLLVAKFFHVLVSQGFYHGDLHSGNIFYSYKNKQITLIDFGAMGEIDLFDGNETTLKLLTIIIMSFNYDYDAMLDILTDLLNERCLQDADNVIIDKNTEVYQQFKTELITYKLKNTLNVEKEKENSQKYVQVITGDKRVEDEKYFDTLHYIKDEEVKRKTESTEISSLEQTQEHEPSIYDYLERIPESKETVIENKDVLPVMTEMMGKSESVSFAKVMELIIKFYASVGVNIAIKFAELNELQKAYALLLGVLSKTGYNSYRMNMAIKTGVLTWSLFPKLFHFTTTSSVLSTYWNEKSKYGELKDFLVEEKKKYLARKIINQNKIYQKKK
jgi:serine/threonine protein kinase